MKAVISVPEDIFRAADRYARRIGKSRSKLYAQAVSEYLARHSPDAVTEAMNEDCRGMGKQEDGFVKAAARRTIGRVEW
jgi:metal-responsive CopG/Arc/MetJ family transcriptional regulator